MPNAARSHLTPSTLIASIALVVALGTGAATALPGKNTVDKNDIKRNAVKSKQVKNGSLTGADVADGSLTGADVADNAVTGADVDESTLAIPDEVDWVRVDYPQAGNAVLLGSSRPGFTVIDQDQGETRVTAPIPVADCALNVTVTRPAPGPPGNTFVPGLIHGINTYPDAPTVVEVGFRQHDNNAAEDIPFSLMIAC